MERNGVVDNSEFCPSKGISYQMFRIPLEGAFGVPHVFLEGNFGVPFGVHFGSEYLLAFMVPFWVAFQVTFRVVFRVAFGYSK